MGTAITRKKRDMIVCRVVESMIGRAGLTDVNGADATEAKVYNGSQRRYAKDQSASDVRSSGRGKGK